MCNAQIRFVKLSVFIYSLIFRSFLTFFSPGVHQGWNVLGPLRLRNQCISDGCAHDTAGGGYQWGRRANGSLDPWSFPEQGTPKRAFFFGLLWEILLQWMMWGYPMIQEHPPCLERWFSFLGELQQGPERVSSSCDFPEEWANLVLRHLDMYGNLV